MIRPVVCFQQLRQILHISKTTSLIRPSRNVEVSLTGKDLLQVIDLGALAAESGGLYSSSSYMFLR